MVEGFFAGVLLEAGEHFQKHLLAKVLLGLSTGEVSADDGDDEGEEHIDKLACRPLISPSGRSYQLGSGGSGGMIHGLARGKTPGKRERYEKSDFFLRRRRKGQAVAVEPVETS